MGRTVVIAEKPSVGRDIARVLGCQSSGRGCLTGGDWVVTWAVGHLVTLVEPDELDEKYKRWSFDTLPILPAEIPLKVIASSRDQFAVVRNLINAPETDRLICATDAGREGELIFRYIYEKAACKKPFDRLWISSMTDEAIQEGFRAIRSGSALAEAMSQADDDRELARFYRRKTTSLRLKLWLKTIKRWFMYTPWVRHIIMRLGLAAIHVEQENK